MKSKKFILFLTGPYSEKSISFYKRESRGKTKVAVDGGYKFFYNSKTRPDILIGDMDSIKIADISSHKNTKIFKYPVKKNKTDLELALDFALENKATEITVVFPAVGEIDHFIGALFSASLYKKINYKQTKVSIINPKYTIYVVENYKLSLKKTNGVSISVLPLIRNIELTTIGMSFDASKMKIEQGQTKGMRNKIEKLKAEIKIAGKALVVQSR